MKKTFVTLINFILVIVLLAATTLYAEATTVNEIKNNINKDQNELAGVNDKLLDLQDKQDLLEEEISDLDAEMLNTMTEIGLLEDEIAAKEADIVITQEAYAVAKQTEEEQYEAMVLRIRFMYEQGETNYIEAILSANSFSEALNQASYIEAIYEYDRKMLAAYEESKNQVMTLWEQLETDRAALENDKTVLEEQTVYLDGLLAKKKAESENFDALIAKANQEANLLKQKIKQEQAELKRLEEEERRQNAANGSYTVSASYAEIINNASGSDLGKQIARYGCQYIGNPYVLGGTSLTKGADCSGFIYRIYSDFGYSVPRTSYQQRSAGTAVKYADAQPGDIICYDGHVGLYIGGGYIVHASNVKTGIKVSKATYREILSVRRIV